MFSNRYEAIAYYKKQQRLVDDDLQAFLVHHEKLIADKVKVSMQAIREYNDLIDWNRSELKKEQAGKVHGFKDVSEVVE